ncbi:hypothetical protein YQE_07324, partial [Dendroctonus ponderosae]
MWDIELDDQTPFAVVSVPRMAASYGKKNGLWNQPPGGQSWSKATSRKASMVEADVSAPGSGSLKPSSGRVIRIVNNADHTVQEVRSFSQLRNEFADVDTFYLGAGLVGPVSTPGVLLSPVRRGRARMPHSALVEDISKQRRARSKSRPRALYAPESEIIRANDYTLLEVMKEEPIRVTIKGLRRTFYPPSHHAPMDNSPPEKKMLLEWLLYYVAAIAVMFDRDEDTQRHYLGHTEDIQCMDLHPSREMVASGQKGGRNRKTQAHIRIWSTQTLQTLYVFGMGEFELGVVAVAFSFLNGGSYVLGVDGGRESILSVWQWQWGHLLGKVAVSKRSLLNPRPPTNPVNTPPPLFQTLHEEVTGAVFHPLDDNLMITHGKGHLTFWNRRKDGFFERTDILKPFEQDGDVITGDSDGFITIYSVDADGAYFVKMEYEAHNKGVGAVVMLSEGTLLSGGEKDRRIAAWDSLRNYKKITEVKLPELFGGVRSIYPQRPGRNDGNIYVGTVKNNILEGSLQRRFNQVGMVFGHGRQLWGLAVHPDDEVFATAGHDKNIALWRKNKLIWTTQAAYECIALTFHPFGVALAAGSSEGHLLILNAETGQIVNTIRVCGSPLNCVGFNPSESLDARWFIASSALKRSVGGELIAIASQNGSIYLFRVSRDGFSYKKANKIRGSQPLMQVDWSSDSSYLQAVTADYDLSFWDVKTLTPEKSPIAMKEVKWATHNATVGFMVSGVWNNRFYPMTSLVSTVCRSAAHDLLVSGDTDGYLRLFRYPCLSSKAEYNEEKVYSGTVACARFLFNDRNVVTVGGNDASLMLWQLAED